MPTTQNITVELLKRTLPITFLKVSWLVLHISSLMLLRCCRVCGLFMYFFRNPHKKKSAAEICVNLVTTLFAL
jgi:hypothetical protein